VQRFPETQSLLLIGKGFLIFPLTLRAERQGTTLYYGYCGCIAVSLAEQTQGGRSAKLILSRFGDLLCLEDGRKQKICVASREKVIDVENLSMEEQEFEAVLLSYLASFYQVERRTEHVKGVS
jgi:hypothetical protein